MCLILGVINLQKEIENEQPESWMKLAFPLICISIVTEVRSRVIDRSSKIKRMFIGCSDMRGSLVIFATVVFS